MLTPGTYTTSSSPQQPLSLSRGCEEQNGLLSHDGSAPRESVREFFMGVRLHFAGCALLFSFAASASTPLFEPFTLPLPLASIPAPGTPFNSSSLGTHFLVLTPSGASVGPILPFYTQDFARSQGADGAEVLVNTSGPYFAVRFAPSELGVYTFQQVFTARPAPGVAPLRGNFTAAGGPLVPGDGFARVRNNKFTLDNVTAFWLVGENMAWPGCWPYFNGSARYDNATGSTYMYDRFLPKLAEVGGNWIRLWVGPSLVRDVSYDGEAGSFLPLAIAAKAPFGEYNLAAAWRVEYVVELCRRLGVKISLVMETSQCFSSGTWGFWGACAFNAANGGPLGDPKDVFSNPRSYAEFEQRSLYALARYGHSTSIFSFEHQNEADDWPGGFDGSALAASLSLADLFARWDAYGHLVDNSFGGVAPLSGPIHAWEASPRCAFTSVHAYNMADVAEAVFSTVTRHVGALQKPCFMEEFGARWEGPYQPAVDPAGVGMHTGAWASLVGLGSGSAMVWFWAEVDTLNTYGRLRGAAALAKALGGPLLNWQWATWNGEGTGCNDTRARGGWSVAVEPGTGALRGALAWLYNKNYTQAGCGNGCQLDTLEGVEFRLGALPSPAPGAQPRVAYIDTASGQPLGSPVTPSAATSGPSGGPQDLALQLPPFAQDVALWVEWV